MQAASFAVDSPPLSQTAKSRIDELAEDIVDLTAAEGCATYLRLNERGWGDIELRSLEVEARKRAREMMVRPVVTPTYDRAARMAIAVREGLRVMPNQQVMTMHLQNRGISKAELDDFGGEVIAMIADAWAHEAGVQ